VSPAVKPGGGRSVKERLGLAVTGPLLSTMAEAVGPGMAGPLTEPSGSCCGRCPVKADIEGVGAEEGEGGDLKSGMEEALVVAMVSSALGDDVRFAGPERGRAAQTWRESGRVESGRMGLTESWDGERRRGVRSGDRCSRRVCDVRWHEMVGGVDCVGRWRAAVSGEGLCTATGRPRPLQPLPRGAPPTVCSAQRRCAAGTLKCGTGDDRAGGSVPRDGGARAGRRVPVLQHSLKLRERGRAAWGPALLPERQLW